MRKVTELGALLVLLFLSLPAMARDIPRVELFGGYSYERADISSMDLAMRGWNASITENVNNWFGGVVEFSGHYAHPAGTKVNVHSFMFGPVFSFRKMGGFTPFAHGLIGAVHGSKGYLGLSEGDFDFGAAAGGGLDIDVHRIVSIRLIQADYVVTPFLSLRQNNVRVSAGIILRFGKK